MYVKLEIVTLTATNSIRKA